MRGPVDIEREGTWRGGAYSLAVLFGPRDDQRMPIAAAVLWRVAGFRGDGPPADGPDIGEWVRGVVEPVAGRPIAAAISAVRTDDSVQTDEDWLFLDLPMGALSSWYSSVGAFPFGPEGGETSRQWREPIESWLLSVGSALFEEVMFKVAITGWESSATFDDRDPAGGGHCGVLLNEDGQLVSTPVMRWDFGRPK
jgi:hypothetical protein